jgi:hypothetical protein
MANINFPNNPSVNDEFLVGGKTYVFDGVKWVASTTVNKSDIGLGNVQNYSVADQADAVAGSFNNKYMTPLRTAQAIAALETVVDVSTEYSAGVIETNNNTNTSFWSGTQAQYDQFGIVSIGFENFLPPEENNQQLASGFNVPVDFATAIQKLVIGIGNFDTVIYDKGVYLEGFTSDPNAPAGSLSFLNPDTSIQNPNEFLQFYLTGDFGPAFGTQRLYGTNITSNSVNITSRWDNSPDANTLYFIEEV